MAQTGSDSWLTCSRVFDVQWRLAGAEGVANEFEEVREAVGGFSRDAFGGRILFWNVRMR